MRTVARYSIAVGTTILAIVLSTTFTELIAPMRLVFFWAAVLVTALLGGVGPGLAALVSSLIAASILSPPQSATDFVRLALFAAFAGAITLGVGRAKALAERLRASAANGAFINRASDVLASSLDHVVTLRALARLCVPSLGSGCIVQLADGTAYEEGATGGATPSIVAPMKIAGRTIGTLAIIGGREEDAPLIEELARRAAIALDNARLYEAAESANRAKDEFLATLSHELRTPLTAIAGWAHMLQLGTDEATEKLAVDTIVRSARAQTELIDDLLDLSRVVAGTLHLHVATHDLVKIAGEVIAAARPAADAKNLTLEQKETFDGNRLDVRGDERRLRQVLWNLVMNAVKFTDRGGRVTLTISVHDTMARVEVADTGRGIEPHFLPHVWDRFRQADSSTSRQHGGLGLGLAVVRHLVELHGGTVHAASEGAGRGATFAVALPLARLDDPAHQASRVNESRAHLLHDRRILVVDDDDDARIVLAAMLRQFGAEVVKAASATEALGVLREGTFDAVVSDIAMPDDDGFSLVRRVRQSAQVPVIAVSALATGADDRQRALEAGFADFVRKPVDPHDLAVAVAACVR